MKPIKLKITGLNSFIQTQTIDFEELGKDNLFCISGSTGSGKTTIVDAIILALYGSTKRGKLEESINLSSQKAVVELTIELEGERYIIVREIRKKSGNTAKVYKESGELIKDTVTTVDEFILSKIGLEKDQFTRVVMLQQGEFDKFLSDRRTDRISVIEKLTDVSKYKRAIELIKSDERDAKTDLDNCKTALDGYGDISEATLNAQRENLAQISTMETELVANKQARSKALEEAKNKLVQYKAYLEREEKIKNAKAELDRADKELTKLSEDKKNSHTYSEKLDKINSDIEENGKKREEISGYLAKASTLSDITKNLDRAVTEYKAIALEKERKAFELEECKLSVDKIKSEYGFIEENAKEVAENESSAYTELYSKYKSQEALKSTLIKTQQELAKEEEKLKVLHSATLATEYGKNTKAEESEKSKAELEKQEQILDKLRTDNAVGLVLSTAKVGDVCPVCGNVITSLSHVQAGGELAEASVAVKNAKLRYENAQSELNKAEKAHVGAISEYDSATKNVQSLKNKIDELKLQMGETIDAEQIEKSKDRAQKAKSFETFITKLKTLSDTVKDKEENLKKRKEEGDSLRRQETELKALLTEKCGTSDVLQIQRIIDSLRASDKTLQAEKQKCEDFLKEISDREIKLTESRKHKQDLFDNLNKEHTYCEKIDQTVVDGVEKSLRETEEKMIKTVSEKSALCARIEQTEKLFEQKKQKEKEYAEKEKRYGILKELKELTKGDAFTNFVADAFIEEITADASARMSDLSSGQYTLFYNGEAFFVKDYFSAGESRNVSTLSGGEKFLASLSLAIAISRKTAHSRDYGFFFIDEGFGTLDGNAIETVCASLEALALDTVVGVITHREELIERIPSVLEVEKADGENGSICKMRG
ncbi:MAG: SMC family ATPase [Clostridia bacterium]|nr:SMC family ATPase [Clostridia bacterium]